MPGSTELRIASKNQSHLIVFIKKKMHVRTQLMEVEGEKDFL